MCSVGIVDGMLVTGCAVCVVEGCSVVPLVATEDGSTVVDVCRVVATGELALTTVDRELVVVVGRVVVGGDVVDKTVVASVVGSDDE